jgi:parallel beta-helix repeat protein
VIDLGKGVSILLIGSFLLLMFSIVRCRVCVNASPKVIHVPSEFPTIQSAIDNASSGDTILVASGTYREYLNINKSLSIVGENRTTTVIDGDGADYVVSINSDNVTIEGLTITKTISGLSGGGIHVSLSNRVVIYDVEITNTSTGLNLYLSSNGVFSNNIIINNTNAVMINSGSNSNVFSGNIVSGNYYGVVFNGYLNSNVFSGNTFSENLDVGVYLSSISNRNFFYHNNFLDTIPVQSGSTNVWSRNGEGNYWVNYNFTGRNAGDGIGDEPNYIDQNNQDDYPLMGPFSEYDITYKNEKSEITIISNSTISNFRFEIGTETGNKIVSFDASGEDGTFGFCRMTIPRSLMGYPLIVVDREGEVTTSLLSASNETITYLYFVYPNGDQNIAVISSETFQLESELLDDYAKLQADLNSLNGTYQALLTSYNTKLQAEIDSMNATYQTLLNSLGLLLQNLSQLQNNYVTLNSSLEKNLIDQSESVQNIHNLTYIFAAMTGVFLVTTAYLSTRVNGNRKLKGRVVEEEDKRALKGERSQSKE